MSKLKRKPAGKFRTPVKRGPSSVHRRTPLPGTVSKAGASNRGGAGAFAGAMSGAAVTPGPTIDMSQISAEEQWAMREIERKLARVRAVPDRAPERPIGNRRLPAWSVIGSTVAALTPSRTSAPGGGGDNDAGAARRGSPTRTVSPVGKRQPPHNSPPRDSPERAIAELQRAREDAERVAHEAVERAKELERRIARMQAEAGGGTG